MAQDKLPIYNISIDPSLSEDGEQLGMTMVAYTSTPAIMTRGMAFDVVKSMVFADELKYRLAAPALIPDLPIYREDPELGAYNVVFSKECIEKLREDFMLNKSQAVFNLDHNSDVVAPSYILDSWITGPSESDPSFTKYGIQVPEGSWFIVSQFTDKEFFKNEIIAKDRIGYSIEGFLGLSLTKITQEIKQNKTQMKLKFEIKKLEDGTPIWVSALEVGAEAYTIDENLDKVPLFDGTHILADGEVVSTINGKITEVKPKSEAEMSDVGEEEAIVAEDAIVEEEMAEVPVVEEAPVAVVEEAPVAGETATKEYVDGKLEELYKLIAELKTMVESDVEEDVQEMPLTPVNAQMSLAAFFKTLND